MAKEVEVQENTGGALVEAHYEEKGAKATKDGKDVIVNIDKVINVVFTKDYGQLTKGHTQGISEMAFEIYSKAGVVEKV